MKKHDLVCECNLIHGETVSEVKNSMAKDEDLNRLSDLFKNFADFTRARILWALGIHELCVCDLASLFGMTKSAISHQLKVLRLSNLVKNRKEGKTVYYSLADSHVLSILKACYEHILE